MCCAILHGAAKSTMLHPDLDMAPTTSVGSARQLVVLEIDGPSVHILGIVPSCKSIQGSAEKMPDNWSNAFDVVVSFETYREATPSPLMASDLSRFTIAWIASFRCWPGCTSTG